MLLLFFRLLTGLAVLAICLGGGYSCIALPFGGDQFASSLPSQKLSLYFSLCYYVGTVSGLVSTIFAPILRHDYQCFGKDTCFPLAFSVLYVMLVLSLGNIIHFNVPLTYFPLLLVVHNSC